MIKNTGFFCFLLTGLLSFNVFAERTVKIVNKTDRTVLVAFCPEERSLKIREILSVEVPPMESRVYSSNIEGIELGKKGKVHFEIPDKEILNTERSHYVKMPLGSYRRAEKRLLSGKEQTFRVFMVPVLWQTATSYKLSRKEQKVFEVSSGENGELYQVKKP